MNTLNYRHPFLIFSFLTDWTWWNIRLYWHSQATSLWSSSAQKPLCSGFALYRALSSSSVSCIKDEVYIHKINLFREWWTVWTHWCMQTKPTKVPEWITSNNISQKVAPLQLLQKGISCPHGTVIVKRTTIQDLIHLQRLKSIGFNSPRHVITEGNNIDLTGHHVITLTW